MESDDFFEKVDHDVFVANAEKINVYVRYADTTQGSTTPNGSSTFKVEVSSEISCVTNSSYGFHHWAAFSTNNFNINGQNPGILYSSNNNEYYKGQGRFELSEDVVTFENKNSTTTNVTIHQNRRDIVLVPVVAVRPSVDRTSPPNSARDVVRNTSIRCIFTKKMTLSSFTKDTVKITSGYAVLTDVETPTTDITDRYIWGDPATDESYSPMISASGKLVTFRLKNGSENYIDSNQQITVAFSPELKDADGYEEGVKNEFYFITGTSIDALAPILQEVKGGINGKFKDFNSEEKANGDTIKAKPFEDTFFNSYLPQRVKDYVNIYIFAADIGGEGTGVSIADPDENAVIYYGTRARLLYDSNGEAVDSSAPENNIEIKQEAYVANGNYVINSTDITGGLGCAFTYDLGALPDGIVEIDVWAVDSVGNSGFTEPHYDTYDNGYRALIVVKDTTPPVADVTKISAHSDSVEYGWYNATTLGETNLSTSAAIVDSGNVKLRSADDKIKWIFSVGDNAAAWRPAASDGAWRIVTAGDYALTGITARNEGAVGILMSLMDDMGNISTPVSLGDVVMFDKTKPAINTLSWVNASGAPVQGITSDESLENYLKINFTEEMSGVREVILDVNSATGIANGTTKFFTEIGGAPINYSIGTRDGKTCAALAKPADGQGYKTGSIFVQGIDLGGGTEGKYTISAALCDAALNTSAVLSKQLGLDKTPPVLNKIVIPLIERIKRFGEDLWRYFIGKDACISNSITVQLHITEETSGIKVIDFSGGDIKPSAASTIKMTAGGVTKNVTDFTVSGGVITFGENQLYEISNENEFILEISGCQFTHIKSASHSIEKNLISVKLTDFAGRESGSGTPLNKAVFASDNDEYMEIFANALPAATPTIVLVDRGTDASGTADLIPAQTGFTNYEVVKGTVTVPVSGSTNDFVELKLADGALFTNTTTITAKEVGGSSIAIASGEYSISTDKKSIVFTKAFSADIYSDGIELTIENIEFPSGDGAKTVAMQTLASTALASSNGTANITLDTAAPLTRGACSYTTQANYYPRTVDTVTPTYGKELASGGIPYFYANDMTRQFDIINKETSGTYYKVDDNEYSIKISTTKTTAADIYNDSGALTEFKPTSPKVTIEMEAQNPATASPYSYIVYDVAGNCSDVKQFYLIKDEAAQVVADNKITPSDTATAHFFKNVANATDHTRTYVMKQATNEYKIEVDLSDYAEKLTNANHSGLAQWAITSDGANPTSWQNYDSTQNSGNIEYFINSVTEGKKLTLFLKDNCGNTTNIDIKDSDDSYANTILWSIDSTAPIVEAFYPLSTRTSLTAGTANASTDVYGSSFFKNNPQTTYYNDGAALGVKYSAESCLYTSANATETATDDYTVKARLYFTLNTSETVNENTFATATERISDWYYFADVSGGRTFFVPYPTRPEGAPQGKLYLLLEDKVGNQSVTQVTFTDSKTVDKFVYINNPPRIVSGASDYSESNIPLATSDYYVSGSTIYVNGSADKIPSFNIDLMEYKPIRESISGSGFDIYYLYSNDGTLNWASVMPDDGIKIDSADNLSAAFDKKVPVGLLDEAGASATPKELYLYVRDVVGNNQKKQLGTGKKYLKDSKAPEAASWGSGTQSNPGNSNISQQSATGKLKVVIAASGNDYKNTPSGSPFTVYIPKTWFTDNDGSGVKGIAAVNTGLGSDLETDDHTKFKLQIPASVYAGTKSGNYYVYDNVGNIKTYSYETDVDDNPPKVEFEFTVVSNYLYSDSLTLSDDNQKASLAETNTSHDSESDALMLWSSNAAVSLKITASDNNGIASIKIGSDETVSATTKTVSLTAGTGGVIHTVVVTDTAGNTTTLYFNLQLDTTKPTFENPTATPNDGARIKTVSGTKTLYYNSLALSAKISDGSGVGLESYKKTGDAGYTSIAASDIVSGKFSFTATENAGNAVTVYAKDKLKNEDSISAWKVGTETISTFVFDNIAPVWAASPITVARNGFVNGGTSQTWESGTAASNALASYDSDEKTVYIKSNLDANIVIAPSATDSSGIVGYIASTTSTKPTADSTTEYPTQFLLACGEGKTTGFVDTIKKTIPTTEGAATSANFNLKLANSESLTVYFFPVDYAGNVGDAQQVTFTYQENRPVVSDVSVAPAANSVIYRSSGINYFRGVSANAGSPNAATGEDNTGVQVTATIALQDEVTFPLTGFKLVTSSGTELAHHTYATGKIGGSHTFNLPYSFSSYSASDDIYIVFYNAAGDSSKHLLNYKDPDTNVESAKWREDAAAPNAPTAVTQVTSAADLSELNDGSNYFYLSETTLYYKDSSATAYLYFTVSDNTANASGIKGVGTSVTLNSSGTITNPYAVTPSGSGQTFYAYDNVLNRETTGYEITYIEDTAAPNITGVTVAGQSGSGYYRPAGTNTFYFNANSESAKKVTSITFTVNANDEDAGGTELSGIRSYEFKVGGGEAQKISANTFTLNSFSYTTATSVAITVIDNVGNRSETQTFTLTPDSTAPTATIVEPTGSGYYIDGANFYFTTNTDLFSSPASFTLTSPTDGANGSDIKEYYYQIGTGSKVTFVATATTIDVSVPAATDKDKTISLYALDNVGNERKLEEYTLKLAVDMTAPTVSQVQNVSTGTAVTANIFGETGWENTTGKKLYFNSDTYASGIKLLFDSAEKSESRFDGIYSGETKLTNNLSAAITASTTLTVYAKDKLGNKSGNFAITVTPDGTAPDVPSVASVVDDDDNAITAISPVLASWTGGTVYFNAAKANIVFDPTDDVSGGSGFDGIYKWNSATSTKGDKIDGGKVTATSDSTAISVVSVDKVGNISAPFTLTVKKDTATPEVAISSVVGNVTGSYLYDDTTDKILYYNAGSVAEKKVGTITITLTASDAGSGINEVTPSHGTATKLTGDTYTVSITAPASQTDVTITATDKLGNTSDGITIKLVPDSTAPIINYSASVTGVTSGNGYYIDGNTFYYNSTKVTGATFTVTSTDTDITSYSYNGTSSTVASHTLTSLTSGGTLKISAMDKVGNTSDEITITFTADGTGPTGSATITSTTAVVTVGGVTTTYYKPGDVTFDVSTVEDAISDLDVFKYSTNGGTTKTDAAPASNIITLSLTGNQSVNIYAYDRVGNESTVGTFTLAADGDAPTISNITASGNTSDAYSYNSGTLYFDSSANTNITISLLANDVGSGVATVSDGTNNFTESSGTYSLSISAPSTSTTLSLVATDKVGNASAGDSITLTPEVPSTYGFTAPTLTISAPPTFYNGLKSITLTTTDIDTDNKDSVTVAGQTTTNTLDGNDLTLTFDSAVTGGVEITLPAEVTAVTAVKVTDGNDKERTITNAVAGASMFSRARAAVVGAADVVATGVKKAGSSVVNSVKSLFGISSKPTMVKTVINNASANNAASETASVSEIAMTSVVNNAVVENAVSNSSSGESSATANENTLSDVTVPNIKKESVVRTLTYSTEEELSPTASVSASSTETEPATAHRSLLTVIVLLLTAILASVVAFSAVFLLKKK